jgi:hypothetical protein
MNIATCHIVDINHMHTPLKPVIGYILILKAWGRLYERWINRYPVDKSLSSG